MLTYDLSEALNTDYVEVNWIGYMDGNMYLGTRGELYRESLGGGRRPARTDGLGHRPALRVPVPVALQHRAP